MTSTKKIGLALSGGGARGVAHIGAIQALEAHGIFADVLSGASAGAIVGALYAAGKTPAEMMDFVKDSSFWKIFQIGLPIDGLAKLTYLNERLADTIETDDFSSLKKELHIAVANLNKGNCELRSSGTLFSTVMASCAVPLIFKPIELNGDVYVDGGLLNNLPVGPLRAACDIVIGINVMPNVPVPAKAVQTALGIAIRSFELSVYANTIPSLRQCDVVIEPKSLHQYHIFQFNKFQEIYDIGYRATLEAMPEILALVGG
ncbi:MAG: patatin-like phospholipase family protein [Haliscomenobacter sp.]|nr:patatin-like phospholipase family protein [Haliscomenobacter sp.]MBK8877672.1 patatin-like phospholipase family protein [Haliscomenobacter sp.]